MKSWGHKVEIVLLLALCFFLPLYEAPKSIAWLLYLVAWIVNRVRGRDFGGRWDLWDTLIATWIASGFVVAAFAGLHGSEWRGAVDLVRYGSLLFVLRRSRYSPKEMRSVLYMLIASVLIGLGMAYWSLWRGKTVTLQINSVGHVSHTSIYVAIMLGACVSLLLTRRTIWVAVTTAILFASLAGMAIRSTIGSGIVMLLVLSGAWWPRSRRPLVFTTLVVLFVIGAAIFGGAEVVRKQEQKIAEHNLLSYRDRIWRTAVVGFERYPLFGVGMDNYGLITLDKVRTWRQRAGKDFDESAYFPIGHAHSLIFNTLAERGIVGAGALGAVLLAWLVFLIRYRPNAEQLQDEVLWWGCAAAAWMITVGAGVGNTTLHHEHAILAVLFLGLWLSRLKSDSQTVSPPANSG